MIYVECRRCNSSHCNGCNNYILSKMLHDGKFDCIMDEYHTINPEADIMEVKYGEWIGKPIAGYSTIRCSVCGDVFASQTGKWKYCPNCGAKMSI